MREGSSALIDSSTLVDSEQAGLRGNGARLKPLGWLAAVMLAYVLATVLMTWPAAVRPMDVIGGTGDSLFAIWAMRWIQHGLVDAPLRLFDANIFYPFQDTLAYTDSNLSGALVAVPIYMMVRDQVLTFNILVLATFPLAALGMFVLIARLAGNRAAAFLAGLAYSFLPYRFAHLDHYNHLLGHVFFPWILVVLLALVRRPTWRTALVFGLLVAAQVLTSFYFGFQLAIVLGAALLVLFVGCPQTRTRPFLVHLVAALGITALLVLPVTLPYFRVRSEQGLERTVKEAEFFKAMPSSYLLPAGSRWWDRAGLEEWAAARTGGEIEEYPSLNEQALFPGGLAIVGAFVGLVGWRRRRGATITLLLLGGIAFVLSLGPTLGPRVVDDGVEAGLPLPFRFLFEHVTVFRSMRAPARFGLLVDLAVVGLAALGIAWSWERLSARINGVKLRPFGPTLTALLVALLLGELWAAPVALTAVDRSLAAAAPYEWLARQDERGPVMEFPATNPEADDPLGFDGAARAMFWSTWHWMPLVNGYAGNNPSAYLRFIKAFESPLSSDRGRGLVSHVNVGNAGLLQDLGVYFVVVHRSRYAPEDWPEVVARLDAAASVVEEVGAFGEGTIYRVRGSEAPVKMGLSFRAAAGVVRGGAWEPEIMISNASSRLVLLYLEDPLTLTISWRDEGAHEVKTDEMSLRELPPVVPSMNLVCSISATDCRDFGAGGDDWPKAPPPSILQAPNALGRYAVRLEVSGSVTAQCDIIVSVSAAGSVASGESWTTCPAGVSR